MKNNKFLKLTSIFLSIWIFLFLTFVSPKAAHAEETWMHFFLKTASPTLYNTWTWSETIGRIAKDQVNAMVTGMSVVQSLTDAGSTFANGCTNDEFVNHGIYAYNDNFPGSAIPVDETLITPRAELCTLSFGGLSSTAHTNGSLLAVANSTMSTATQAPPPANLAFFFQDLKNDSFIFQETYAAEQDMGFTRILAVWKMMRNIAYGLLSLFLIATALMISLRKKLDPQTVVTAQAALPKIVISAVLITFSYAISAIFVQMSGWNGPVSKVLINSLVMAKEEARAEMQRACILPAGTVIDMDDPISAASTCMTYKSANLLVVAGVGLGYIVLVLVVFISFIFLTFALLFVWIKTYITLLFLTIIAPIKFAIAALPGKDTEITNWFKDMLYNAIALPMMMFSINLTVIIYIFLVIDPVRGGTTSPVVGGYGTQTFSFILGFMMLVAGLFMTLKVPSMVSAAIKGEKKR